MIALLAIAALLLAPQDYEGDWYVSDTTDNNSGERQVYAFQSIFEPSYITLTLRCSNKKPAFFVEWGDVSLPDVAVLSIGPIRKAGEEAADVRYVFEKSREVVEGGYRATPEVSRSIVADIGTASHLEVTAHLPNRAPMVGFDVKGTQQAWARVVRHCPPTMMPKPPK